MLKKKKSSIFNVVPLISQFVSVFCGVRFQLSRHHMKERQLSSERQSLINELSRSQRDK